MRLQRTGKEREKAGLSSFPFFFFFPLQDLTLFQNFGTLRFLRFSLPASCGAPRPPSALSIGFIAPRVEARERSRYALRVKSARKPAMMLRVLLLAAAFIGVAFAALDLGDLHLDLRRQREETPQQQQQPDCDSASYQKSSLTLLSSKKFAAMYLRSAHMRQFEASGVSIGPSGQGEKREERKKRERVFLFLF